ALASATRVRIDGETMTVAQAVARPLIDLARVAAAGATLSDAGTALSPLDTASLDAEFTYEGYLKRDEMVRARTAAMEARPIPAGFEYRGLPGLSREV